MTIGINVTVRNAMGDQITAALDAGATGCLIRIYDGTRPATGGTATTLLAELTGSVTSSPAASGGVVTMNAITQDSSANATGTATWFRMVDSSGTFVLDGSVGASGADLNLTTTAIVATQPVSITSATFTIGNA